MAAPEQPKQICSVLQKASAFPGAVGGKVGPYIADLTLQTLRNQKGCNHAPMDAMKSPCSDALCSLSLPVMILVDCGDQCLGTWYPFKALTIRAAIWLVLIHQTPMSAFCSGKGRCMPIAWTKSPLSNVPGSTLLHTFQYWSGHHQIGRAHV